MSTMRKHHTGLSTPPLTADEQQKLQEKFAKEAKAHEESQHIVQQMQVYHSADDVKQSIQALAEKIQQEMKDEDFTVLTSLSNADIFAQSLMTCLNKLGVIPKTDRIDIVRNEITGVPEVTIKPGLKMAGRKVLILKSLVRGGVATDYAMAYCKSQHATEVYVAALLDCVNQREAGFENIKPNFVCFQDASQKLEAKQLLGCGLGVSRLRALPMMGYVPHAVVQKPAYPTVSRGNDIFKIPTLTDEEKAIIASDLEKYAEEYKNTREVCKKLRIFLSADAIEKILDTIADRIAEVMQQKPNLRLITSLMGALLFAEEIRQRLNQRGFYPETDMIYVSRYGDKEEGGEPVLLVKPRFDLRGCDVMILEDLIEGGATLDFIKQACFDLGARSVMIAVLFDKVNQREEGFEHIGADIVGHEDTSAKKRSKWWVGHGCDQGRRARNYPDLCFKPIGNDITDEERPQPDYILNSFIRACR